MFRITTPCGYSAQLLSAPVGAVHNLAGHKAVALGFQRRGTRWRTMAPTTPTCVSELCDTMPWNMSAVARLTSTAMPLLQHHQTRHNPSRNAHLYVGVVRRYVVQHHAQDGWHVSGDAVRCQLHEGAQPVDGCEARQLVGRGCAVHQHRGEAGEEVGVRRGGGAGTNLGQEVLG